MRARFEFDISWLKMFVFFKTLNFLFLLSLLFCKQKRINVQKNESERAGKAFCYCLNFLSILDLPINLTLYALRFEFDISRLIVCVPSQNLEFLIITFLVFLHIKANKCAKKMKASVLGKSSVRCHCCCRHCDCLNSKCWKNIVELSSDFSVSGLIFIKGHPIKYVHIERKT